MSALTLFFLIISLTLILISSARFHESEALKWRAVTENSTTSCGTGNVMDDCWRCDADWDSNRQVLANCSIGFGGNAIGGRDGDIYTVSSPDDDDPVNPVPGTLRHAVIQDEPLWIIFDRDMVINLKEELIMNSYKTIDGRGFDIQISNGPCITIQNVSNIIIHGIYIHDCVPTGNALVRDSPHHYGLRGICDGDGISIFGARDIWIDHCTLASCNDGLIDVVNGSTSITISNNYMLKHNEAMLMGHSDDFLDDKKMQVTIAFNYFGEGLVQRMPRCRHGFFHIVNNVYSGWKMYAIGGSANPTINSQGNIFIASDSDSGLPSQTSGVSTLFRYLRFFQVTKRESQRGYEEWKNWNWRSDGDLMLNGAFFTPSGEETPESYAKALSMEARPASLLEKINLSAGVLRCKIGLPC